MNKTRRLGNDQVACRSRLSYAGAPRWAPAVRLIGRGSSWNVASKGDSLDDSVLVPEIADDPMRGGPVVPEEAYVTGPPVISDGVFGPDGMLVEEGEDGTRSQTARMSRRVVFPLPLRPSKATNSPPPNADPLLAERADV
jgi:hypothetical protein